MRMSSRPALVAAFATLTIAFAPAAAHADDAAIKAAMPGAFNALAKKEKAASVAIAHFNKHKGTVSRADRRKIWAVASAVKTFRALLAAQQASTPQGAAAQKALLAALKLELTATQRIDLAMKSAGHTSVAHTNKIVARANKTLRKSNVAATAAIKKIQAL
jgi:hypothetical protein